MGKAMFINVVAEGRGPIYSVTKSELAAWVANEQIAFSCLRDPDGADFNARDVLGTTMTGYIVERATRKIVIKDLPETDVLRQLDTLP